MSPGTRATTPIAQHEAQSRRRRALARLAERREADAARQARARSMARHPSAGRHLASRREVLGLDAPPAAPPRLEVVRSSG